MRGSTALTMTCIVCGLTGAAFSGFAYPISEIHTVKVAHETVTIACSADSTMVHGDYDIVHMGYDRIEIAPSDLREHYLLDAVICPVYGCNEMRPGEIVDMARAELRIADTTLRPRGAWVERQADAAAPAPKMYEYAVWFDITEMLDAWAGKLVDEDLARRGVGALDSAGYAARVSKVSSGMVRNHTPMSVAVTYRQKDPVHGDSIFAVCKPRGIFPLPADSSVITFEATKGVSLRPLAGVPVVECTPEGIVVAPKGREPVVMLVVPE